MSNLRIGAALAVAAALLVTTRVSAADPYAEARSKMVQEEIVGAGVKNPRVIEAVRATPRHEFVPPNQRPMAYYDMALPIGESQTISPPFIVAYMTEQIDPQPTDRVLEIGTGSGYQAAVLSPLVKDVYTIEIVPSLGRRAREVLERLHYDNVHPKIGDGYQGWPEHAPFDKIIVTCSPEAVPQPLVDQLREGGLMVIPVGERYQQMMYLLRKENGQLVSESLRPTLFVPMTGTAEDNRQVLPDPARPAIRNGDFEEILGDANEAAAWHYQRQMEVREGELQTPSGDRYALFTNHEPGRGSQALQGFAVDGREVRFLDVTFQVRGEDLRPGQNSRQMPHLAVHFYDERRSAIGYEMIGPWRGTFGWRPERGRLSVPVKAREAIIRIGLGGAVGTLGIDAIRVTGVK